MSAPNFCMGKGCDQPPEFLVVGLDERLAVSEQPVYLCKQCLDSPRVGGVVDFFRWTDHDQDEREDVRKAEDEPNRICAEDDCDTILSRYSKARWCSIHERSHPPKSFGHTGARSERTDA